MGYEGFNEFDQMFEGLDEEMLLAVLGVVGVFLLIASLVAVVGYVLQSVGLYTIAKNRGIKNPWLAWLPVGTEWIAGSIADQYQYVVNGQVKNRRKILLILGIASMVLSGVASALSSATMYADGNQLASLAAMNSLLSLLSSGVQIATLVFWHISLYDLYTSCNPEKNVLFLVLGIIFGVAIPYFIFFNRNKELGMPRRKNEPEEAQWVPQDPPEAPWENT